MSVKEPHGWVVMVTGPRPRELQIDDFDTACAVASLINDIGPGEFACVKKQEVLPPKPKWEQQ